jgi:hypothetical protein
LLFSLSFFSAVSFSQTLQLHYDFRHTIDPAHNTQNFPTLYFEYFKSLDSGKSFIKPGSFLIKIETDMQGANNNIGKSFIQAAQSFRCWEPKIYLSLQYSGGLGVTEPRQYSFYIANTFSLGPSYPFQWKGAWFTILLSYSHTLLKRPSNDPMFSFYWGKGFWNYKVEFVGDFELFSVNRNTGDDFTANLKGKAILFFAEPQIWFKVCKSFSMGSKFISSYHVYNSDNIFEIYPTIGGRIKFQ